MLTTNPELKKNLKLAEEAADYARGIIDIKNSHTAMEANELSEDEYNILYDKRLAMQFAPAYTEKNSIKDLYKLQGISNESPFLQSEIKFLKSVVKGVKNFKVTKNKGIAVGSCREYMNVAANYLNKKSESPRIELFILGGGDHGFVVIGRAFNSQINNFNTWGEAAVVCDPWNTAHQAYAAKDISKFLKSHKRENKLNKLEDYNPEMHQLISIFSTEPNSLNTKFLIIQEAIKKLKLIKLAIANVDKQKFKKMIESINETLQSWKAMTSNDIKLNYDGLTNLQLEKKFNKEQIYPLLNRANTLAEEYELAPLLKKNLIREWINDQEKMRKKDELSESIVKEAYYHLFTMHPNDIIMQLIDTIPNDFLNKVIANSGIHAPSLIYLINEGRNKEYFNKLIPKLTSATIRILLDRDLSQGNYTFNNLKKEDFKLLLNKLTLNDLRQTDEFGNILLTKAAAEGMDDFVDHFIKMGISTDIKNLQGLTPLHCSVIKGQQSVTEMLLKNECTNINAVDNDGSTPLIKAIIYNHVELVELLLLKGAKTDLADQYNLTPLHFAAEINNTRMIELLLKYGADANILNRNGWIPALIAAGCNHVKALELLFPASSGLIDSLNNQQKNLLNFSSSNEFNCQALLTERKHQLLNIKNSFSQLLNCPMDINSLLEKQIQEIDEQLKTLKIREESANFPNFNLFAPTPNVGSEADTNAAQSQRTNNKSNG